MLAKILFSFFLITSLYAEESNVDIHFEFGMSFLDSGGTIQNTQGTTNFNEDYKYTALNASYFSIDTRVKYDYIPNIKLSYHTLSENQHADINSTLSGESFTGTTASDIEFNILNATIYQDIKSKGSYFTLFSEPYYSGDIEFDIGTTIKMIEWQFNIQNAWIKVSELIALPYIGVKYYLYDLVVYADASALAFGDADSTAYNIGIEYEIVNNLYLGLSYVYEDLKVTEATDTVDFSVSGYRTSFKYVF